MGSVRSSGKTWIVQPKVSPTRCVRAARPGRWAVLTLRA
jgi:hypothetical protein